MSKKKTRKKPNSAKSAAKAPERTPNPGANRKQRRELERSPRTHKSNKPLWLRVVIIAIIVAMVIGFFLVPLLR